MKLIGKVECEVSEDVIFKDGKGIGREGRSVSITLGKARCPKCNKNGDVQITVTYDIDDTLLMFTTSIVH